MPIILTPLGPTLEASIIDVNFETIQDMLGGLLLEADITGDFRRWRIMQYTSGQIVSAHAFANPLKNLGNGLTGAALERIDIPYREKTEDAGQPVDVLARVDAIHRAAYEMELLGKPGPSFYYSWQYDGYNEASVFAGVAGWPPGGWPPTRYPQEYCFSRFLTCPGASVRVYVPHACIARIHGMAKGYTELWGVIEDYGIKVRPDLADSELAQVRFALVVDTNPHLFADEFPNANPNIKNPLTGIMAPYKSWEIVKDRTLNKTPRETHELWGEIALKGGRYYNFSMKYTDALTHGWINKTTNTWDHTMWEDSAGGAAANKPVSTVYGISQVRQKAIFLALWENCSINVEFIYGRDQAHVIDSESAEFQTKA